MSLGNVELELDNRGLVLIEGKNESNNTFESNGSGKSSTLTTITYSLFGQTPYGLKADDVINRKVGDNMSVILHFEVDGTPYRVERYRKHRKHKNKVRLFQGDTEITGKSAKDTDSKVQELFGIDYPTYTNSILQGQGEMEVFTKATDKGKKEILENITNISVYKKAQEVAKEKASSETTKLSSLRATLNTLNTKLENLDALDETDRNNYTYTSNMIKETETKLEHASSSLEQFESTSPLSTLEERKNLLEAIEMPEVSSQESSEETALKEKINTTQQTGNSVTNQVQNMVSDIHKKKKEQEGLDTQTNCSYCGAPLDASHAEKEYKRLEEEIGNLTATVASTKDMFDNQFTPMLDMMKSELQQLMDERYESIKESQREYQYAQQELSQIYQQINQYNQQVYNYQSEISSLEASLESLNKVPKPVPRDKEREELNEEIEQLNIDLLATTNKQEQYENAVKIFSNSGIRSIVLDLVTPYLNERANKYLATLSGSDIEILFTTQVQNKDGSLADKFDVQIINASGGDSYKSNSEGEKRRIDLAISFAIQDLVLSKTNLKTNIAMYDECFEGLDEVGCENVITILKERQEQLGTIFVITHNKHLASLFESVITVEKKNGISEIIKES